MLQLAVAGPDAEGVAGGGEERAVAIPTDVAEGGAVFDFDGLDGLAVGGPELEHGRFVGFGVSVVAHDEEFAGGMPLDAEQEAETFRFAAMAHLFEDGSLAVVPC